MTEFKTLKTSAKTELTERRSVFFGYACPAASEDEALAFIDSVRKKHSDATHNVYAYLIRENNISRFSDDGEPHGTAGLPVLEVLRKNGITDAALVVTRYFGGVLLGTGGLVRAYSASAKSAVDAAGIRVCRETAIFSFECDYQAYQKISRFFELSGVTADEVLFGAGVRVRASCDSALYDGVAEKLTDLTGGKIKAVPEGTVFR